MFVLRVFFCFLVGLPFAAWAQSPTVRPSPPTPPPGSRIELLPGTRELVGGEFNGVKIRKLLGNVSFKQQDTFLYCDSAYQYLDKNEVEAFSNVRVVQNDTLTITGDHGYYDGTARLARMTGHVVMHDPRMTLTTDALDYDLNHQTAAYTTGGHLTDPNNVLDSQQGFYDTNSKVFVFKTNVHLVTPDSDLKNDTLRYNTASKLASFNGPTYIKDKKGGSLYAEKGTYNTLTRLSNFEKNAKIDTKDYLLSGDGLVYDELKLYGVATGHVAMVSKKDNVTLRGDKGRYWRGLGRTKLYGGRPVARAISEKDTLYLAADTLLSIEAQPLLRGAKKGAVAQREAIYAWPKVQIYRGAMQGRCDSLTYDRQDSVLYLNRDPVLWQARNQLTADSMQLRSRRGKLDQMRLYANSFVVGQDTLRHFNQVKGRNMVASFRDNKIARVKVLGNAESLYYALDGDTATTGLNRALAANLTLRFADSKLTAISLLEKPEARFIPPQEWKAADQRLAGFRWRATERPTRQQVLGRQFADPPRKKETVPKKKFAPRKNAAPKRATPPDAKNGPARPAGTPGPKPPPNAPAKPGLVVPQVPKMGASGQPHR